MLTFNKPKLPWVLLAVDIHSKQPEQSASVFYFPRPLRVMVCAGFHYSHQLISLHTLNQRWGSNQWNCLLQRFTGMKTYRCAHCSGLNIHALSCFFQRLHRAAGGRLKQIALNSICRLVRSLSGLRDPRAFPLWGKTVLWPLGIFSLYNVCEVMFSRPCACSHVFVLPKSTIST